MIGGPALSNPSDYLMKSERLLSRLSAGDILIGVHSEDPVALEKALGIFTSEGADHIYDSRREVATETAHGIPT
jgi:hypothetical protein